MSSTVGPQSLTSSETPPPERLNGWKEIAGRLGKGVRTAQRWEKAYGLPVHRMGRDGGALVFAFTAELELWTRQSRIRRERATSAPCAEPLGEPHSAARTPAARERGGPPAPRLSGIRRALGALALGSLVMPALWAGRTPMLGLPLAVAAHRARTPAGWSLDRRVLTVRDERGERLFEHEFDFELRPGPVPPAGPGEGPLVEIADIDGDGFSEVLLAAPAVEPDRQRAYCFEADGSLRFVHQPRGSVRFGDHVFAGPWVVERVFVTRRPNGLRGLWVASAQPGGFPAWLQELAPDGGVRQEYRADGRITSVSEARWAGHEVVFVGAADPDQDGASVAIFDRDAVAGSAPASKAGYDCTSCALGSPREFLAFPRLGAASDGASVAVADVRVESEDGVTVATAHRLAAQGGAGAAEPLLAHYAFDRALDLLHAEIAGHSHSPADDARLLPVRRFDGGRFVTLPAVAVGH